MGECFLWYRPTRVVPDQRPLTVVVVVAFKAEVFESAKCACVLRITS